MSDGVEIFRTSPACVMTMRVIILFALGALVVSNYVMLRGFNTIGLIPLLAAGIVMFNIEHKVTLSNETLSVRRGIYHKVYPLLGTEFRVSTVDGLLSFLFSLRSRTPALYVTPIGGREKRFMLFIPQEEADRLAASLKRRTRAADA